MLLLFFVFFLLFAVGLYNALNIIFKFPSRKSTIAIRNAKGRVSWGTHFEILIIRPFANFLSKFVSMNPIKRERLSNDLDRMNVDMTPEVYIARSLVLSIIVILIGIPFALFIAPWTMFVFIMLGVYLYFKAKNDDSKRLQIINDNIEMELPCMIETLNCTLQENRSLITFFERYLAVAGKELRPEIEKLVLDMKTGNSIQALNQLKSRLRIASIDEVVYYLIGIEQGIDQGESLNELVSRMDTLLEQKCDAIIDSRPRQMYIVHVCMIFEILLFIGVPFAMIIFGLFNQF